MLSFVENTLNLIKNAFRTCLPPLAAQPEYNAINIFKKNAASPDFIPVITPQRNMFLRMGNLS